ncbi:MAG TPA: SPW repeat protein [Pseudoxanthomonas sp.]
MNVNTSKNISTTTKAWPDWTNLTLGLFLAVSPWLALGGSTAIVWNAVVCGGIIACAAGVALLKPSPGAQKTNLWIGLWLLIAPFVLSFWSHGGATWTSVLVGLSVAGIAGYQLSALRR